MSNGSFGTDPGGRSRQEQGRGAGQPPVAPGANAAIKDVTTASFSADVVAASRRQPVIVDFWAPWCGPCRQLTPVLERVVQAAGGRVHLAKMNIDEHPSIPGQLGVRSIPAVFAFVDGRPVDGFMGAVPESEVKAFVDRLLGGASDSGDPIAEALLAAEERLAGGDAPGAAQLFAAVLQEDPDELKAVGGLAACYLALGDVARAEALIARVPPDRQADPALAGIRNRLKLAAEIAAIGDPQALRARLEADPADHQARYDLALVAEASGRRADAASGLLEIVRRDRTWNDDGARRKLVELFDAWGAADPATRDARRGLSALLFS